MADDDSFSEMIPLSAPDLSSLELEYVAKAVQSSWISSTGEFVDRFESEFSELLDDRPVLSASSGTAALHLSLLASDIGPGDEVIVPTLTYVAVANAVRYVGAEPVFVDVDPDTWCITSETVAAACSSRTKAVIAVHLYGHPADMDAIAQECVTRGIILIEDAAEAHFASYRGRQVGTLSDISIFSFYGNKIITCGEGGAISFRNQRVAERARLFRGQGMDPNRRYYFPVVGFNYRLSNMACAVLCAQLARREEILEKRRQVVAAYKAAFETCEGLSAQGEATWARPAPWMFSLLVNEDVCGIDRDQMMKQLELAGIETRPVFIPMHQLPPHASARRPQPTEVAELIARRGFNLPTSSLLTASSVDRVIQTTLRACGAS